MRVSGGGTPCLGVGRPGLGAPLSLTTRSFGPAAGAHYPLAVGAGGAGVGTGHQAHRALLRARFARCGGGLRVSGRGRGSCLRVQGRALFRPRPPALWGVRPGPTTLWLWVGGCGRRDPSPTPQRALLRAGLARCGGCMRAPRRGRLLPGCGPSRVGRSPTPDHSSFRACGRGPLPTGCWCGGRGHGDRSPTPQRMLLRARFAHCGGGTKAPGGVASCLGVGLPGSGALPPPITRPFGRAAGAHYPLAVGAGAAGVGTCHQPHSARSCVLALRAVEAA